MKLAEIYGEDPKKAEIAALFHDMYRGVSENSLNYYVKHLGLDNKYVNNANLAHGKIAAIIMERDFDVDDKDIGIRSQNSFILRKIKSEHFGRDDTLLEIDHSSRDTPLFLFEPHEGHSFIVPCVDIALSIDPPFSTAESHIRAALFVAEKLRIV